MSLNNIIQMACMLRSMLDKNLIHDYIVTDSGFIVIIVPGEEDYYFDVTEEGIER